MSDRMKTERQNEGARVYLRPFGFVDGTLARDAVAAGAAAWLAGGPAAFTGLEVIRRDASGRRSSFYGLASFHGLVGIKDLCRDLGVLETFERLTAARVPLDLGGGRLLPFTQPLVMGILNVTPDSFSDGGSYASDERALAHGQAMLAAGADLLDVGGESTRPGSDPVTPEEETRRVLPVIRALVAAGAVISIDSRHAASMRAAAGAGAHILNDVSALEHDPLSLRVAREVQLPVVLMHAQGDPKTMQQAPDYEDAMLDVYDYLAARVETVVQDGGIARDRIVIDPGVGFGKGLEHNLEVLRGLSMLHGIGCAILLGVSRKSFIGKIADEAEPKNRLPGALAVALKGVAAGVQILRVHDVAETVQALRLWRSV